MRRRVKKGTTATLVLLRAAMLRLPRTGPAARSVARACTLSTLLWTGCGNGAAKLTEWRAEDHQPPTEVVPAGQGAADESGDPTARAASALWSMRCATCHGEGGQGDGTGRPPGAALPDFTSRAFQESRKDEQLFEVIEKGRNMMPAFGKDLTPAGVNALIQHLRSLRAP